MNYTFLLVLAAFLVVTAPIVLLGAHREGKRRREARARRDSQRADMAVQELRAIARPSPPYSSAPAARVPQQEIYRFAQMILQAYQQREDLPTNKLATPKRPDLNLSELLYEAAKRDRPASKA